MPAIFFTAHESVAAEVTLNHDLPADDVVELGGVDTLRLSTLWAIMDRKEWDPGMMSAFGKIKSTDSEWTDSIPSDLTHRIASIAGDELARVAEAWSATDEMRCTPDEAKELLSTIAPLAQHALTTQRPLFLYVCL